MLNVDEALGRILSGTPQLPSESAPIEDAVGRALSADVTASRTLPPWDNSAMDGFAVRSAEVPARLRIIERIFAGQQPRKTVGAGECARIMTGAPMPHGADAVVMQEKTSAISDNEVEILEGASPRLHVRDAGEDARAGQLLLAAGTPIGIPEAGLLWAQGLTHAPVPRRPLVSIVSTGDELCEVTEAPDGRIVDSNSPALALAVRRAGGVARMHGVAKDDLGAIIAKLEQARGADVILTSAGVSVGERDFVRDALSKLGATTDFWRIAIKPGKPLLFGKLGRSLVFGLPGNPTSSLVTFELFVRPALRRMLGLRDVLPVPLNARIEVPFKKAPGLRHFVRAIATPKNGELWVRPLPTQLSGVIRSAALATHLIVIAEETTALSVGDQVGVVALSWTA